MAANAPFIGIYAQAIRDVLPCLTGQETKVFLAIAAHIDQQGKCWPGVREISAITTYPPQIVSDLLKSLQDKNIVVFLRQAARDPLTGRMVSDVYGVNPEIVLVSDPTIWNENRLRHASIPESTFSVKPAQADRFTEAESEKHKQRSRTTAPEAAATLPNTRVATRNRTLADIVSQYAGADSAAASANAPNSHAQRQTPPPGSGAPPSRDLSFPESVVANAIRREISDMSADTARSLIARYGIDQVNAAVLSFKKRNEKRPIGRPTGWIIRNLESGAKR